MFAFDSGHTSLGFSSRSLYQSLAVAYLPVHEASRIISPDWSDYPMADYAIMIFI